MKIYCLVDDQKTIRDKRLRAILSLASGFIEVYLENE
jgi:hypothetical protein